MFEKVCLKLRTGACCEMEVIWKCLEIFFSITVRSSEDYTWNQEISYSFALNGSLHIYKFALVYYVFLGKALTSRYFPSNYAFPEFTVKYSETNNCIHHLLSPFWIKIVFSFCTWNRYSNSSFIAASNRFYVTFFKKNCFMFSFLCGKVVNQRFQLLFYTVFDHRI